MKLLTVAIPCYNSQDYMEHAVETALVGGEDVEIILVNDGSSDKTAEIADRLQKEHPTIVRAIHQENGGHGAAVNTGLANASGLYYKVLDSDDWFDRGAFLKILDVLRSFVEDGSGVDTAPVVQEIFKMKLQGVSDGEIIRTLNRKQIPSPGKIRYLRGMM